MGARGRAVFVFSLLVAACAGGDDTTSSPDPATTLPGSTVTVPEASAPPSSTGSTPSSTSSTIEAAPTTEGPAVEPVEVGGELALLVPAPEGLALWQRDRVDWLVTDRPVAAAVPDLAGGVLFQYVDPAEPEWVWDERVHRWVTVWPSGEPEPIRRQRAPGGPTEVAVSAGGSRLWLLDVGIVDGQPAVAFGRLVGGDEPIAIGFPYCAEVDMCGEFSWRVEMVVRPIGSGAERVVRRALWQPGITESTEYSARLGPDLVALTVHPWEGDDRAWSAVEFVDPVGGSIDPGYRISPWCTGCDVVADLAPVADALAYVERYRDPTDGRRAAHAEAVLVDTTSWVERWRIEVSDGRTIDTDGQRLAVLTASTCANDIGPELGRGDEGAWVERLQLQLNRFIDAGLDIDGRYGPATEVAVRVWQRLRGMPLTGAMEPYTWVPMLPDRSCTSDLVVIEDATTSPIRLDTGWGLWDPAARRGAPMRGPALWVEATPDGLDDVAKPPTAAQPIERSSVPALRADGIGPVDFGTPAEEAAALLVGLLGEPSRNELRDLGDVCLDDVARHRSEGECTHGVRHVWILQWADRELEVRFADVPSPVSDLSDPSASLHFDSWHSTPARSGSRLATSEGISAGSSVGEVRLAYPATEFHVGESMFVDWFRIELASGTIGGWLDWGQYDMSVYVAAVQRSLNAWGADLVADGIPGPRTLSAWDDFCRTVGPLDNESDRTCEGSWIPPAPPPLEPVIDALGFPPADIRIAELSAYHVPSQ